ncbi:MAG: DUF308 domain-containing protein [Gammaproteobacteria bacterium]|nr:DUF308 domain-containing protein [Gammaproteobacteria bacterium]
MADQSASASVVEISQSVAHRGWFIFEGVVFLLLGVLAILFPFIASVALEIYLGALLVVGGIATGIRAIAAKGVPYRSSSIVLAALTIITGLLLLIFVPGGLLALTLTLATFFIVQGIFEIARGVQSKGQRGRGWLIVSGLAGLIVGLLLWLGLPSTALWAVGTLTGINLIFTGIALLALTAVRTPRESH